MDLSTNPEDYPKMRPWFFDWSQCVEFCRLAATPATSERSEPKGRRWRARLPRPVNASKSGARPRRRALSFRSLRSLVTCSRFALASQRSAPRRQGSCCAAKPKEARGGAKRQRRASEAMHTTRSSLGWSGKLLAACLGGLGLLSRSLASGLSFFPPGPSRCRSQ
jgi:hypothetical protein